MSSAAESAQGHALAKFFEHTAVPLSGSGGILAIRSTTAAGLTGFDPGRILCLQTNRTHADALERAGFRVVTEVSGAFALCLIEATRDRDENLHHIALGWSLLAPDGRLVLSAANALGGESLARRIRESGLTVDTVYSKAKCRVVCVTRTADGVAAGPPPEWLALGDYRELPRTGLVAGPGVFSAHTVDPGSRLLCEALDTPLVGRGADFGAGYGALSHHVLARSAGIRMLDLYESEWKALAAAKINLAPWQSRVELGYRWTDITLTAPDRGYDWIIMNPPFHSGTAAEPALGQRFIHAAANSLDSRGTLWMVANRHLPYETVLGTRFKQVADLGQSAGYKVYRAAHPVSDRTALRSSRPPPRRVRHRSG
ncbi:MAG: methyltransferase [Gammaproteobacteria bacterium]|nr:methyltransferase [Gammaproteobacteria bacterium]